MSPEATELLERAGVILSWCSGFQNEPPAGQEGLLQQSARELALYAAPIGRSAIRIGAALDELVRAIETHLEAWPKRKDAEAAAREALTTAGLKPRFDSFHCSNGPDHFSALAAELRTWLPLLEVMGERLEECGPPDEATGPVDTSAEAAA